MASEFYEAFLAKYTDYACVHMYIHIRKSHAGWTLKMLPLQWGLPNTNEPITCKHKHGQALIRQDAILMRKIFTRLTTHTMLHICI